MKKLLLPALALAALGGAAAWWGLARKAPKMPTLRTAPVVQRDVQKVVSATGALTADPTVQVGTQVSGLLAEVLVDYNDRVAKDQVLARLDTALLQADVDAARARLEEGTARRDRSQLERERVRKLHARGASSDEELQAAQAEFAIAEAQVRASRVALTRARRNLSYATIRAPIAGTVVRSDVDVGQTVNAGFSAPLLFEIAADLARMTILVNVDESDVAMVKEGQLARFTVPSWPDRSFEGKVRQVRKGAKVEQGVVTYTVVVDVDNADEALLPGMTATVEFVVAEAKDVLCAPNPALRFRPDDTLPVAGAPPEAAAGAGGSPPGASGHGGAGGPGGGKRPKGAPTSGTLWTRDGEALRALPVTIGLRGAECVEVSGEGLSDGLEVVLGVEREEAPPKASASPFGARGGGGGGGGGHR
jgi:HlyD family secretion protein